MVISLLSCGQNLSERQLNGRWYEIQNSGNTKWEFYPDSLNITIEDKEKVEWNATKSKIEFGYPTLHWDSLGIPRNIINKITIDYKLTDNKDSLYGIYHSMYGEFNFSLLKAKDYIDFLTKRYNIDFSLPDDDAVEEMTLSKFHGLNVFMGYSGNNIIGKTELSDNLNHFKSDILTFKDSIHPDERQELMHDKYHDYRFHIRVFADKKIPDSIITQYLSVTIETDAAKRNKLVPMPPPRDSLPIRIYRMYKAKEEPDFGFLRGRKINTNAKYLYN
ncbi:hypothetical protein GCM10011344_01220 [Dokdonia pacifica]|uniref:Uncharacterized protein n=1 Tax=Dokdonia pacifica TaxID=1627892 RepID=A0A239CWA7_9FLAO|nr:hypothetical protein [Dokdonia pacifica]GGG04594.1 hypothetical protein GCM10011344_01220 [Dokdonia pacifica]SNS24515.1 hypothetical protein SAMN06265376_10917 [Dokdonia pacifica]